MIRRALFYVRHDLLTDLWHEIAPTPVDAIAFTIAAAVVSIVWIIVIATEPPR